MFCEMYEDLGKSINRAQWKKKKHWELGSRERNHESWNVMGIQMSRAICFERWPRIKDKSIVELADLSQEFDTKQILTYFREFTQVKSPVLLDPCLICQTHLGSKIKTRVVRSKKYATQEIFSCKGDS